MKRQDLAAWINIAKGMKVGGVDETAPILARTY